MRWIPAFLIFGISSCLLYKWPCTANLDRFGPVLITVNFAMAIFSINFAFSIYQSSDYKQFHPTISSFQIYASLCVVLLAMTPLFAAVFDAPNMIALAMAALPLVALSSVILLVIARRETNPVTLIQRLGRRGSVRKFMLMFCKEADHRIVELKELSLTELVDTPTHEWSWHIPPDIKLRDPFNAIAGIAFVALSKRDVYAYQRALEKLLYLMDEVGNFETTKTKAEAYKVKDVLIRHVKGILSSICEGTVASDKTGVFLKTFLDVGALCLARKAGQGQQTSDSAILVLAMMQKTAQSCLSSGQSDSALIPLIVTRQIVQKGMDTIITELSDEHKVDAMMFEHTLSRLPYINVELGRAAIKVKDSDFLYRCFDAYGWLGCSAIKRNNPLVGRTCLRALAQLGREARAAGLECFWDHCALTPVDHAEERIWWILSWLDKVPEENRSGWVDSIEEAYSRINGRRAKVNITKKEDKSHFSIAVSKEAYRFGYSKDGADRVIDYSDFSVLKDFELY